MNIFEKLSSTIDSLEFSFTTFVSKVVPWLVPIIPATVTGIHVANTLEFGTLFGWIAGVVVEGLGFASTHRLFLFWENNKRYTAEKNQMPLWLPIVSFLWYLVVVILVNILLEVDAGARMVRVISVGALTTLSIPTMAIIASTSIMTERKLERNRPRDTSKSSNTSRSDFRTGRPSVHRDTVYKAMDDFWKMHNQIASFSDVKAATNLPESTVSRLRNEWIDSKGLN